MKNSNLEYVAKENNLSDWEIKAIMEAKEKHINGEELFKEKWLDQYFGIYRKQSIPSLNREMSEEKVDDLMESNKGLKRDLVV